MKRYRTKCAGEDLELRKSQYEGNVDYVVVDETTDTKNRKMVNVIVAPLGNVSSKTKFMNVAMLIL